jgi:hypothetical protein
MKVFVSEVRRPDAPGRFDQLAAASTTQRHGIADSPDDADIVLFTDVHYDDWRRRSLRKDPLLLAHRDRTLVYDEADRPWLAWPGIYASMPRSRFDLRWQRAWLYPMVEEVRFVPLRTEQPTQLVSFTGSPTHGCREPLFGLRDPRLRVTRVEGFMFYDRSSRDFDARRAAYERVIADSHFVLCPRGHGTGSFRLQEVLAAGRVPVVISDEWVPPHNVDLSRCVIRWPERAYDGLLDHLASIGEDELRAMQADAAEVFDRYFSRATSFDRIVDLAVDILATRPARAFPTHGWRNVDRMSREVREAAAPTLRRVRMGLRAAMDR